jgi:regulator of sigma E protease
MLSGNTFITIIEFVIALGILITLHELGHLIVAKLFKIEVEEFGLGFPPRIARLFTISGTEFTINWIPFGAFIRPKGENDPDVPGGLAAANPWKRFAVLLGGPLVNIVTGILLFSVLFTSLGAPDYSKVQIMGISPNSPAALAGLKEGDNILKINGQAITASQQLSTIIQQNLGKEVTITVDRKGQVVEVRAVPRVNPPPNQGALGISMGNPVRRITWIESLPAAGQITWDQIYGLLTLPGKLAKGSIPADQARPVGPIGMFDIYSQVRSRDIQDAAQAPNNALAAILNRLWLMATISVALGITNLLPIPALDGGRILFVLPEILFHRRIPPQYENMVHLIGFAALLILMVYITSQDILRPITLP